MKKLTFSFSTSHDFSDNVRDHSFTLRSLPFSDSRQTVTQSCCDIKPEAVTWFGRDSFGNQLLCGRIEEEHDNISFHVSCVAEIANTPKVIGKAEKFYYYQSPMTAPSEELTAFYKSIGQSSDVISLRASNIASAVCGHMVYERGHTNVNTDAAEAFSKGRGVCQDYVHIFISLCRLDGIAARYVSGLAYESGETHAWAEYYDGECWNGIDPTNNMIITDDYIKFCHGRDYSDCPVERGIYVGNVASVMRISSEVKEL